MQTQNMDSPVAPIDGQNIAVGSMPEYPQPDPIGIVQPVRYRDGSAGRDPSLVPLYE
jgi:hypothetical protein